MSRDAPVGALEAGRRATEPAAVEPEAVLLVKAEDQFTSGRLTTRHWSRRRTGGVEEPPEQAALGIAALSVSRSKGTFLAAKYRRLQLRRGKMKALVAVQRALLVTIWTLLNTGAEYIDPGADYYTRYDPERQRRRAVRDLEALGYHVTIQLAA